VHEVLREPGEPLDTQNRAFVEPRFGADFSGVRVHTGARAAESTAALEARAYAVGDHIAFAEGEYRPMTRAGRELLAHELVHTIQAGPRARPDSTALALTPAVGPQEAEADRAADSVSQGFAAAQLSPEPAESAPRVHRKPVAGQSGKPNDPEAERVKQLNDNFYGAVQSRQWDEAALYLNGFNDTDIKEKISHLTPTQLRALKRAAPEAMPGWSDRVVKPIEDQLVLLGEGRSTLDDAPPSSQPSEKAAPTPEVSADNTVSLSTTEKLSKAITYAKDEFRGSLRAEIEALFTPEAIAGLAAFAVLYVAAQVTPAGWVADALAGATILVTAIFLGKQLFDIIAHLGGFVAAVNATSDRELRQAGRHLSQAIAKAGVALILALLTKAIKGTVKGGQPYEPPPTGMADVVTDTGLVIRVPVEAAPAVVPQSVPVALASKMVAVQPPISGSSGGGGGGQSSEPEGHTEEPIVDEAELKEQPGVRVRKPTEFKLAEAAEGREFDLLEGEKYPANQVPIRDRGGSLRRLDSYDPGKGEIISRKSLAASNGQLAFADVDTVIGHFQEFALKYRSGATIADVPSAQRLGLANQVLRGDYVLEVPVQRYPIPPLILEEAAKRLILIRDIEGTVY
jgi:hypothetical protein